MAHVIKLKHGSPASWSYIDLTDSDHGNLSYYPRTPDEGAEEITEYGTWRVAGSSVADMISKIAAIEQVFYKARAYDLDQVGAYQVWLTMQPDGVAETWESQIFEGRLELTENILGFDWANEETEVILTWRRAPWWEKYTQLTISNSNGTGDTTVVYNQGDSAGSSPTKKENWLDIAAAHVTGDLPAPTHIVLSGAGIASCTEFLIINNARSNPTGIGLIEGETGTSDTTDATRSGGKYHDYTTPAGGTTGVSVSSFGTSLTDIKNGAWIRMLLSCKFTGTVYATPFINLGTGRHYGTKSAITGGSDFHLYDLGMIRLSAGDMTGLAGLADGLTDMQVGVRLVAETAITVSVDYINYIPTDYFSRILLIGMSLDIASINTHESRALGARNYPTDDTIGVFGEMFGGVYLEPNIDQRLSFKFFDGLNGDVMDRYATVSVYAWLRKRTI